MSKAILAKHGWIVQAGGPIDFGWHLLRNIPETKELILKTSERPDIDIDSFNSKWIYANMSLMEHPWFQRPIRESVRVSWLPGLDSDAFEPIFVVKINENGTTFVVSEFGIPWLDFE